MSLICFWDNCPYYSDVLTALADSSNEDVVWEEPKGRYDLVVVSGWKYGLMCQWSGHRTLVVDIGVFDRFSFLFGLSNPNDFPVGVGERRVPEPRPWKEDGGYALIVGSNPYKLEFGRYRFDYKKWLVEAIAKMRARGYKVFYRNHPSDQGFVPGCDLLNEDRTKSIRNAGVVVTFRSLVGVEAIMEGTPVIATDPWALCWDVSAHHFEDELIRPDRTQWLNKMAWKEYTLDEVRSGLVWDVYRQA